MTIIVNEKTRELFPPSIRRQIGIKIGTELELTVSGGVITMLPKPRVADDEYTSAQRRMIDAKLDEAEKGPFHGPFNSANEMIIHMKSGLKKHARAKHPKRSR